MRINPSALSQALFRFPHFLLLSGMLVTVSACRAFTEETIPMQAAEIEQLFAPEYAAIGAIVSVQLRINSGWLVDWRRSAPPRPQPDPLVVRDIRD